MDKGFKASVMRGKPAFAKNGTLRIIASIFALGLLSAQITYAQEPSITRLTTDECSYYRLGLGWSPDMKKIAFAKTLSEGTQLWIMNADGSNAKPISGLGWEASYGWSPDGKKIVYAYAEKRKNSFNASLYVYNVASGKSRVLASGFKLKQFRRLTGWDLLEWTRDSKEFAMLMLQSKEVGAQAETNLFNVETGKKTTFTPDFDKTGRMYAGSWLFDDSKFALLTQQEFDGKLGIWVCNRDGSNLHSIHPNNWDVTTDPRCSPTEDLIAFGREGGSLNDEDATKIVDLWVMRSDGSGARRLTTGSDLTSPTRMSIADPEWTSDGRYILFQTTSYTSDYSPYGGIYLIDVSSGELIRIIEEDPASDQIIRGYREKVVRSPDGKRIAFTLQQYTVKRGKDGTKMYEDLRDVLYYYDIPTRTLHEVAKYRPLEDGIIVYRKGCSWNPDWSGDNSRLLITRGRVKSFWHSQFTADLYVYKIEE